MRAIILSLQKSGVISLFLLLSFNNAIAQCFTTSWQNATAFTVDNSIGDYDISSPSNAETSNNARATAASLISILSANTYYLRATGFDFNIPSYASICGINVEIESSATGLILTAAVRDNEVKLIKNGTISGTNHALPGDWGSSDTYNAYGGSSDLWGLALAPADVNAGNFGVAISVRLIALVAALPSARIDHIRMQVVYNPILPVALAYFKAERKDREVQLEWKTTEEEEGAVILLQRSVGNAEWRDIQRYELSAHHINKVYHYRDRFITDRDLQYRLCTILPSGQKSYSATKYIAAANNSKLLVYPNPAKHTVFSNSDKLVITDMRGCRWPVSVSAIGSNYAMQVSHLPAGNYLIQSEKGAVKLIKD